MLFKQRIDLAHSKERLRKFKPESMEKHVNSYMRKVYDDYIAVVRNKITSKITDNMLAKGFSEEEAHQAAILSLSVTKMEETKVAYQNRRNKEQDRRIIEYIKYLIGETVNNDFVLKRSEFK